LRNSLLFDTNSLILLIRSTKEDEKTRLIEAGKILYLTFYEVGNSFWTESELVKSLSNEDLGTLVSTFTRLLPFVEILPLIYDDFSDVLEIARKEKVTFYDSSYIHSAKQHDLTLVTDDQKLSKIARKYVPTKSIRDLL
jgi:predicted nucleic acid-binding protein